MHNLKRNRANRKAKQVGRGGTRGKTSGRGTKGQNARAGRKKRPEIRDMIKRLPKLRGRGRNHLKSRFENSIVIKTGKIDKIFKEGDIINRESIIKMGVVPTKSGKVRELVIVLSGALSKKLNISGIRVTSGAKKAIESVGGSVK